MTLQNTKGLEDAFLTAAAELGMCSAAWLFVREFEAAGPEQLRGLRDALGRTFPVLDAVVAARTSGRVRPTTRTEALEAALGNTKRVVVVGLEADALDQLVALRGARHLALMTESALDANWTRVLANFSGAVERVSLATFQRWAGPQSALLTFAYGVHDDRTHVAPLWARVLGDDVRTQFGALLAWDVLGLPLFVYPRWLVEVPTASFTRLFP